MVLTYNQREKIANGKIIQGGLMEQSILRKLTAMKQDLKICIDNMEKSPRIMHHFHDYVHDYEYLIFMIKKKTNQGEK
jgi:hypothetical protein